MPKLEDSHQRIDSKIEKLELRKKLLRERERKLRTRELVKLGQLVAKADLATLAWILHEHVKKTSTYPANLLTYRPLPNGQKEKCS